MKVLSFFPNYGNQSLLLSGGEQVPDLRVEWVVLPNHLFQDLADDRCSQGCAPARQRELVPTGVGQHLNVVRYLFGEIQHRFERPLPHLEACPDEAVVQEALEIRSWNRPDEQAFPKAIERTG